jgi:dynein heavy chain 1
MDPPPTPLAVNGNGLDHQQQQQQPGVPFDAEVFRVYLRALLPPVIAAAPEDVEGLFDDTFDDRVAKFTSDPGAVLYVVKSKYSGDDAAEGASCVNFHCCAT